ncbi:hypothetical protein HDV00_000443, partial [Rhizophlyctis rosea]
MPGITLDELKGARSTLLKKGFLPIPAYAKEKRPLVKWKSDSYTLKDWSKGIKRIEGAKGNVGILTGHKSDVIVLDIDNKLPAKAEKDPVLYSQKKGLEDWWSLLKDHEEPQTLRCVSPTGGIHYYFKWDDDFADKLKSTTNSCVMSIDTDLGRKLCAIDIRGDGGFIMAPPSITDDGQYVWQPNAKIADVPILEMPQWIKTISRAEAAHTLLFANDDITNEEFERFKQSRYFRNHQLFKVDEYQRMILKETEDFDCLICKRRHTHHSNHPFLVKKGDELLFVCRQARGGNKFHAFIKEETTDLVEDAAKEEMKDTPHQVLMKVLWAVGKKKKLQKFGDWIYKPMSKEQPAAYRRYMKFQDFVNATLRGHPVWTTSPKRAKDVMMHLEFYDDADLPFMKPDMNILTFKSGCLLLKTVEFVRYDDKRVKGKVARHYIDADYTGEEHTPTFDKFVMYQLEDISDVEERQAVFEIFLALLGRLFFKVSELDRWGVAPFILGLSNTGKSTLQKIIRRWFGPASQGVISGNHQNVFGLEDFVGKELIVIPETPHNMKEIFDPTVLQTMVTGEETSIVGKHKKAYTDILNIPLFCIGNCFFNYDDVKGAIVRRFPIIFFGRYITERDSSIEDTVIQKEMSNLICKCLRAYKRLREEN